MLVGYKSDIYCLYMDIINNNSLDKNNNKKNKTINYDKFFP